MSDTIITGAYDMHIHTGPDIMERKMDYLVQAERAAKAGMAGFVIKSHYFTSSSWAKVANARIPECQTFGSIVLNNSVGGMNPFAVDAVARDGGKVVWFPTVDTAAAIKKTEHIEEGGRRPHWLDVLLSLQADGITLQPVRILDDDGKILPEVIEVLDVIARYDMVLCTGHISVREAKEVIKAARQRNVEIIVCTHVDSELCFYEIEEQIELIKKYGVYVEHCSNSCTTGKVAWDVCLAQIKAVGCEHIIISTDLGQLKHKYPDEGLLDFANWMLENGISETDVRKTICDNPRQLLLG
jgi:hypothetical protein